MKDRQVIFSAFIISILILSVPSSAFAITYNPPVTIPNPTPVENELFSWSVSVSGNSVLVGVPNDNSTGFDSAGVAYLFDGTTGALLHTINNPTPAVGDRFGESVSVSGNSVLVGVPFDNSTGVFGAGAAYLFDGTTGALLQTFNNPTPEFSDKFGSSVSVSGNSVLVGTPFINTVTDADIGVAYLFDGTTGALLQTFNNPTPESFDYFGWSVSVSGNSVLVSAVHDFTNPDVRGAAYLFDGTTGALLHTFKNQNPTPTSIDQFGSSVSVSGNSVLVGANGVNFSAGVAYLFDGTTGALLHTINNPTPVGDDLFGWSVSVSGNNVLVGAIGDDTGAIDAGAAYLFDGTTGALLQTFNNPTPESSDNFGRSVSVSGNSVLVGAYFDNTGAIAAGAAYLFLPETSLFCGKTIDQFASVINGTESNNVIVGTSGADLIDGLGGDDKIWGIGGDDCIDGGEGNDYLVGGAGNDEIDGENGNDKIWGQLGMDVLYGWFGNDRIAGGADNDSIFGEENNDYLWGQAGDDALDGGTEFDVCVGGIGTNTFVACEFP